MKHSVLIVDDEPGIVDGLRILIERLCINISNVYVAYSGEEGIEKALMYSPDIIITDIRMNGMDGFEMIRKIQGYAIKSHYIILSGFEDFEYARKAISLSVEEYMTKPVDEENLFRVLNKLTNKIRQGRNFDLTYSELEDVAREYRLREYLLGREDDIRKFEITIPLNCHYIFAVFECEKIHSNTTSMKDMVRKCVGHYQDGIVNVVYLSEKSSMVVCFFMCENAIDFACFVKKMKYVHQDLKECYKSGIAVGIGNFAENKREIRQAYEEAICAINYKIILGVGSVITYGQIKDVEMQGDILTREDYDKLEHAVETMDEEYYKGIIDQIFNKVECQKNMSLSQLKMLCMNLILVGLKKTPRIQLELNAYIGKNLFSLDNMSKFETISQLKNWVFNILKSINELMIDNNSYNKLDVVEEAKKYILKYFYKDITLSEISEKFYINPSYFSLLFKNRTGMNYQHYLTEVRINRAKKLLDETDMRIYEICTAVGYADASHFNKMFERHIGVKPGEYRKMQNGGNTSMRKYEDLNRIHENVPAPRAHYIPYDSLEKAR